LLPRSLAPRLPKANLHFRPESNIGSGMLIKLSTPTR